VLTPTGVKNAYMDIDVLGESAIGVFGTGVSLTFLIAKG